MASLTNIVFAHDVWFDRQRDGRLLSARGTWPWDRYLRIADSVTVACRLRDASTGAEEAGGDVRMPGVDFAGVPSLSGPVLAVTHRREADRTLTGLIRESDALIARLPSEIGEAAVRAARRLDKPYAVEVVTCTWDALWNRGGVQGKLYAPLSFASMRRTVRRAPFVLYVTREFLQRRYPTEGHAVACSNVELPPLDSAALDRRVSGRTAAAPFVIGTIAALTVRFKGIQTALTALGSRRARLPPFEFQVVGAGDPAPWRELASRCGIEEHVSFPGVLPAGQIPGWLDGLDLYVQPSFQEGLPRGLIEAMARGCPALGSTAGGIPELLGPDCLHRPGDSEALAELIMRAVDDEDWRLEQARANFETAKSYAAPVLDSVRDRFWSEFADYASEGR